MAARKKRVLTPEEQLEAALVPKSEWPYEVPDNWCWVRLGTCICKSTEKSNTNDSSVPYLGLENFESGIGVISYADASGTKSIKSVFHPGQILYGRLRPYLNKHDVAKVAGVCSTDILVYETSEFVDAHYVNLFLDTKEFIGYAVSHSKGINLPRVSPAEIASISFPLPPLHEQRRITSRIEWLFAKLDDAEAKLREVIDNSEHRRAAILYKAFSGELTKVWRDKHGFTMDTWQELELGAAFDIVGGIQKKPSRAPKDNPVPYLTVANVFRNRIDLTDIHYFEVFDGELEKLRLRNKDILVVEGNGSGNEIGRCAMWHGELPVCIHQNHIIRLRSMHNDYVPEFVLLYLNSPIGRQIMREKAVTTAGLYNLSTGKIRSMSMRFPVRNEQLEIVTRLDRALENENRCAANAMAALENIAATKRALLNQALRGELGTNDPDEPSSKGLLASILSGNADK